MMFALDRTMLQPSFKTLQPDATADEIAEVLKLYPYQHHEHEGGLWFSRFDSYFPGYEFPYGYWIPGKANDADGSLPSTVPSAPRFSPNSVLHLMSTTVATNHRACTPSESRLSDELDGRQARSATSVREPTFLWRYETHCLGMRLAALRPHLAGRARR